MNTTTWPLLILLSFLSLGQTSFPIIGSYNINYIASNQVIYFTNTPNNSPNNGKAMCFADINHDGYKDFIIGVSMATYSGRTNSGMVYVIFGTSSGFTNLDLSTFTSSQGIRIYGAQANDYLGEVIICPGDLNGDFNAIDDIVIGVPSRNSNQGIVYVIFGQRNMNMDIDLLSLTNTQGITISGSSAGPYFGFAIDAANVYGDYRKELIIGSPGASSSDGSVFVIYTIGSSNIDLALGTYGYRIDGPVGSGYAIGYALSYAGDFNDDGIDDFIIGAPAATASSRSGSGIVYVIYGGATSNLNAGSLGAQGFQIIGAAAGDGLGFSVSYGGDANNDGLPDIILAARQAVHPTISPTGVTYVIYGKSGGYSDIDLSTLSNSQGFSIADFAESQGLGLFVSTAGDINHDGCDDIIIGTPGLDLGPYDQRDGGVWVIFGRPGTPPDISFSSISFPTGILIAGPFQDARFARSVASAGDIDGDGFDEIMIRQTPTTGSNGLIYIIYGGPLSYKFGDGSYQFSCPPPFVLSEVSGTGIASCEFPCTTSTDYLYWDGSCSSSCNSPPLSPQVIFGSNFCNFTCTTSTDYLYLDGSCSSTCASPLVASVYRGRAFCGFACPNPDDYLYWNGSCISSSCPAPMIIQQIDDIKLCKKPCSDDSEYYYIADQTCRTTCDMPYNTIVMDYGKTCSVFASTQDVQDMKTITHAMNIITSVGTNGLIAINIAIPGLSVAAMSNSLARLISYTRYLNITASPRLKILYDNFDDKYGLPIAPDPPSDVEAAYPYQPIRYGFYRYNISGSFLVGYWSGILSITIIIAIFMPIVVLDNMGRKRPHPNFVWKGIAQLRIIAQNFIFSQIYGTLGALFLFAFLEIDTQIYGSVGANFSLGLAIICLIISFAVLLWHFVLLKMYRKLMTIYPSSKRDEQVEHFSTKYEGFRIMFQDFRDTTFFSQAYLFFFMLRDITFQLILVTLQVSPFAQILLITLLSLTMMTYLFIVRPQKYLPELLQAITLELIFLLVNLSLLEIAILDLSQISFTYVHYYMGETIIYCSLICHAIPIFFILLKGIWAIKQNWRSIKLLFIKLVIVLGMNIQLPETGMSNKIGMVHGITKTKITAREAIIQAKVFPMPQELDSPTKSLTKLESPLPTSEARLRQSSPLTETGASTSSLNPVLGKKFHLKPMIADLFSIKIPDDPMDNDFQHQGGINVGGPEEHEKQGGFHLEPPRTHVFSRSSDVPRRRESVMSIDGSLAEGQEQKEDLEEEKEALGSTKNLINPDKETMFEDQRPFLEGDLKRQRGLQLKKTNKNKNTVTGGRTTKSNLSQVEQRLEGLKNLDFVESPPRMFASKKSRTLEEYLTEKRRNKYQSLSEGSLYQDPKPN